MSPAARSIFYFGIYMLLVGLALLVAPRLLLGLFADPTNGTLWVRILGLVVCVLGYYYMQAARHELVAFFRASIQARPVVLVVFCLLVLLGLGKPYLILFGLADLLGALWTALALRSPQPRPAKTRS